MARVLIDDFGAVLRLGFKDLLLEEGMDVVSENLDGWDVNERLLESLPNVIILDLDVEDGLDRARRLADAYPAVKVIACSSGRDPHMRVFPPFHRGESFVIAMSPDRFVEEVSSPG